MGKSKAPPAPDYTAAAKATAEGNLASANYATNANRINQVTPYGSLSYQYTPQYDAQGKETGAGWTQTESLTPQAQAALDQQLALNQKYGEVANLGFDKARGAFENPNLDTSKLPPGATGIDMAGMPQGGQQMAMPGQADRFNANGMPQFSQVGQNLPGLSAGPDMSKMPAWAAPNISASGASLDLKSLPGRGVNQGQTAVQAIMSRLQPQLQQQEEALRTRLANQGIGLGSEAYGREQNLQGQRANDLQLQAAAQGISVDEMVRQNAFNEQMGAANVANQGAQMGLQAQIANAGLANQARQGSFAEQMGLAGLNRQDRQQLFGEQMAGANLTGAQRQQAFNEQLSGYGANQAAQANQFNQGLQANQFNQGLQNQFLQNQMAAQGFNQNLRQQNLAEQAYMQDRPLNLINALRSGAQVQNPQFQQFSQQQVTPGANLFGAAQAQDQRNLAANNASNAGQAGMLGGLFQLGGSMFGAAGQAGGFGALFGSHPDYKTSVNKIGTHEKLGIGLYSFEYKQPYATKWGTGRHVGVMADELAQVMPDAIHRDPDGDIVVDYSKVW